MVAKKIINMSARDRNVGIRWECDVTTRHDGWRMFNHIPFLEKSSHMVVIGVRDVGEIVWIEPSKMVEAGAIIVENARAVV